MSIEKEWQKRTYGEMMKDVKDLKKKDGYGCFQLMYEHYREQGYIPMKVEEGHFDKLREFLRSYVLRAKDMIGFQTQKQ